MIRLFLFIGDLGQRNLVIWPCWGVYTPPTDEKQQRKALKGPHVDTCTSYKQHVNIHCSLYSYTPTNSVVLSILL